MEEKPVRFELFRDGLGNFEIFYPRGWRFDEDIAVMDGKYAITFESPDGLSEFTVSVDAQLAMPFDFGRYAKAELESPSSGIYTPVKKGSFNGMPAYIRDYEYASGGRKFFGGGVMFFNGSSVFSLSWSGPSKKSEKLMKVYEHMQKTLAVRSPEPPKRPLPGVELTANPVRKGRKAARAS
ncbi:MAG: hypothetical protein U0R44_00995 [Candidatus Micrarchaeia archaeon]